jgi:hypothetical protein
MEHCDTFDMVSNDDYTSTSPEGTKEVSTNDVCEQINKEQNTSTNESYFETTSNRTLFLQNTPIYKLKVDDTEYFIALVMIEIIETQNYEKIADLQQYDETQLTRVRNILVQSAKYPNLMSDECLHIWELVFGEYKKMRTDIVEDVVKQHTNYNNLLTELLVYARMLNNVEKKCLFTYCESLRNGKSITPLLNHDIASHKLVSQDVINYVTDLQKKLIFLT